MLRMTIRKRLTQIRNKSGARPLAKIPLGAKLFVQFAPRRILEDQVYILIVVKVAVHPENMLVTQVTLNFDFSSQLMLHSRFEELGLGQDLERHDIFGTTFSS